MSNSVDLEGVILEPGTLLQISGIDGLCTFQGFGSRTGVLTGELCSTVICSDPQGYLRSIPVQDGVIQIYGFVSLKEQLAQLRIDLEAVETDLEAPRGKAREVLESLFAKREQLLAEIKTLEFKIAKN